MVKIGGFQSFSLSDFPGEISAIIFTQGCNFRCPFCHNSRLFGENPSCLSEEKIFEFLQSRGKQLTGVVITGGEPTIHVQLPQFIRQIKKLGYAVKLDTNGSYPDRIEVLLQEELLDYIAMDIKAPFYLYDRLSGVKTSHADIKRSIALIEKGEIPYEFRTTWVKSLLTDQEIDAIREMISPDSLHAIQRFCPENAYDPKLSGES